MGTLEMANRFAKADPQLEELINGPKDDELDHFEDRRVEEVLLPLLDRLPPKEADMVVLYFIQHKRQDDIGYICGMTQAAVSYRLSRACKRLRFLIEAPSLTEDEIVALLAPHFGEIDQSVLLGYWRTTSQTETGEATNLTQGRVRYRLYKGIAKLERLASRDPTYKAISKLFTMLGANHNILNEVLLPQWAQDEVVHDDAGQWRKGKRKRGV